MGRPFNIRLWFVVTSFAVIGAICILSAFAISTFMTRALIDREAQVSQEFLESMMPADRMALFTGLPGPSNTMLQEFAAHLFSLPGVIRANIYSADRTVVWSTEKRIVGQRFETNDELEKALQGKRVTEVGWVPDGLKAEHVALAENHVGRYIEAYIPIHADHNSKQVIGVIEFYKLPVALNATIKKGQRIVWIGAACAAIALFLALYWIVQRGARIIEKQQRDLVQMEALAAIGQMASAVAHSLRNPMAAIRSSAELWQVEHSNQDGARVKDIIGQIDRMDHHVRNLLDYSRSSSHALRPVDPIKILRTNAPSSNAAKIDFVVADNRTEPRAVLADELLLGQALNSILTNAVEAMPGGGTLHVTVSNPNAQQVVIEIRDNGGGIPTDQLKRVTESHFTTKTYGFGLGLMLAQKIVERFSGTLDIASTIGIGTSVSITLKAA